MVHTVINTLSDCYEVSRTSPLVLAARSFLAYGCCCNGDFEVQLYEFMSTARVVVKTLLDRATTPETLGSKGGGAVGRKRRFL